MPELPEVETVRKQLNDRLVGKIIRKITVFNPKSFTGDPLRVTGNKITGTDRFGKMIVVKWGEEQVMGVHLKMSGQLIFAPAKHQEITLMNPKHIRVRIDFDDDSSLFFVDQRKFGWMRVMSRDQLQAMSFIKKLGPEPWDISDRDFFQKLQVKSKSIKVTLTDQETVSGIGNIYANDGLWVSGIHPARIAKTLSRKEADLLRKSLVTVLKEGIRYGGSTGQDGKYVHVNGESGKYQHHFKVYARNGQNCLRGDGGIIQKIQLGGRGAYFCPKCQK